ncbi:MAG TPA: hypothetical protein VNE40_03335 [Candidatus Dormibacteraeota bacterium]|nr:hypothetical protein [Candidatus Dormibacteraeota bacterium]
MPKVTKKGRPKTTVKSANPKRPVKLISVWQLSKKGLITIRQHKQLFGGIILINGILTVILVQGLASTNVGSLKAQFDQAFSGHFGQLASSLSVFAILIGSSGNGSSGTAGAYQFFLTLITSLAIIWTLRQVQNGTLVRIRDSYYKGIYPLVPFVLVLIVIGLQLLPLLIGAALYNLVMTNGIAVMVIEKIIWALLFFALALLSLYMLSSSLFALYIVTLPDMTPIKALRSARGLVRNRRWSVLRKILFLPLALLIGAAIIMLPAIIWLAAIAPWIFFLLTMFGLVVVHSYMYSLYRELLNE